MPKSVNVTWVNKMQFIGTDASKHSVVMSAQDEENGTGMSPGSLLLVALGGCTSYDVVEILRKKRQNLTAMEVSVSGEQQEEYPRAYRKLHVHYKLTGRDLKEKAVADAIKLSEETYCSVAATLRDAADVTFDYEIINEE